MWGAVVNVEPSPKPGDSKRKGSAHRQAPACTGARGKALTHGVNAAEETVCVYAAKTFTGSWEEKDTQMARHKREVPAANRHTRPPRHVGQPRPTPGAAAAVMTTCHRNTPSTLRRLVWAPTVHGKKEARVHAGCGTISGAQNKESRPAGRRRSRRQIQEPQVKTASCPAQGDHVRWAHSRLRGCKQVMWASAHSHHQHMCGSGDSQPAMLQRCSVVAARLHEQRCPEPTAQNDTPRALPAPTHATVPSRQAVHMKACDVVRAASPQLLCVCRAL